LRAANGELLAVAAPVLDRLFGSVGLAGACVLIADTGGVVLDWRAGDADADRFEDLGLAPGASWAEAAQGTNGIGTCLVEGRAVTIHRDEHFASRNVGVSCMDAPIFDAEGRLVAALDISSARGDHDRAMAALIGAGAGCGAAYRTRPVLPSLCRCPYRARRHRSAARGRRCWRWTAMTW
jgi:transcriptional regulator of acetoin/glycerol metabolism